MPPAPGPETPGTPWHALDTLMSLARLGAGPEGLDAAEVVRRQERHGPNQLPAPPPTPPLLRFLRQFANPLIAVLLPAAAIMALLGETLDALVVVGLLLANATIGHLLEGRAERALAAIGGLVAPMATVLRDGARTVVPAAALVPGDVVLLQSGDRVPADLRLLETTGLEVQEAALTGESLAVAKSPGAVRADAPLGDRAGLAFAGTMVTRGQGRGVVVATGAATEIGRIAALIAGTREAVTPLMAQLAAFGRLLTAVIAALAVATFAAGWLWRGEPASEMFRAAVGLAIAAVPEGLPAILTITLAIGVTRMARRRAIIRRLPAVETLGAMGIVCTDKTGTLTRNELSAWVVLTAGGRRTAVGEGYAPVGRIEGGEGDAAVAALARAAVLCNDGRLTRRDGDWGVVGDPTDGALLALAARAGLDANAVRLAHPRATVLPFESERQFMATVDADLDGGCLVHLKGAPERVLAAAVDVLGPDGVPAPLDRPAWEAAVEALAAEGLRVLALAVGPPPPALDPVSPPPGVTLLGLVGLIDPPRAEAAPAVAACRAAGIRVTMITGDHAVTAAAIGRAIGLADGRVVTGPEMEAMDDDALARAVAEASVFARATPEHKLRLVDAMQAAGAVVGMTGDGVNDAPALKRADVGVAMGRAGTDAAREAADMVLTDDSFATIVHAVEEGRTVHDNLRKALLYILPTSFGEAAVIVLAVLAGVPMPVTALQVLWVNTVTEVTLSVSLGFEPPGPTVMRRPPRRRGAALLEPLLVWRLVFVVVLMVAGTFALFLAALADGAAIETARTVAVNALVLFEITYLFNCRRLDRAGWNAATVTGNPAVWVAVGVVLVLQILFTEAAAMQALFETRSLPLADWLRIAAAAAVLNVLVEAEKAIVGGWRRRPIRRAGRSPG